MTPDLPDTPPPAEDVRARKLELRAQAREARRALSPEARAAASARIAENLLALPEVASARAVLAYAASPEEADPAAAVAALRARGARVALPCVRADRSLTIHWVAEDTPLEPAAFGLRQPAEHEPEASLAEIDLVIAPLVAFDARGNRLGYGGGYYDRLLEALGDDVPRIGIAFDEQRVEEAPVEAHDRALDAVVTQSGVVGGRRG